MRDLEFAEPALRDLQHIVEFAEANEDGAGRLHLSGILVSVEVLLTSPYIGRPSQGRTRELIIGRGAQGFVARYRFDEAADQVLILGIRGQREAGYDADDEL